MGLGNRVENLGVGTASCLVLDCATLRVDVYASVAGDTKPLLRAGMKSHGAEERVRLECYTASMYVEQDRNMERGSARIEQV